MSRSQTGSITSFIDLLTSFFLYNFDITEKNFEKSSDRGKFKESKAPECRFQKRGSIQFLIFKFQLSISHCSSSQVTLFTLYSFINFLILNFILKICMEYVFA